MKLVQKYAFEQISDVYSHLKIKGNRHFNLETVNFNSMKFRLKKSHFFSYNPKSGIVFINALFSLNRINKNNSLTNIPFENHGVFIDIDRGKLEYSNDKLIFPFKGTKYKISRVIWIMNKTTSHIGYLKT